MGIDQPCPLLRDLGRLIGEGATADELAEDLVRHVDRRAARAHRINELEVKRDQTVSLSELTVVFARWVDALREDLDDATFRKVLPRLRSLTHEPRPGLVGSVDEWEAKEMARGTVEGMVAGSNRRATPTWKRLAAPASWGSCVGPSGEIRCGASSSGASVKA